MFESMVITISTLIPPGPHLRENTLLSLIVIRTDHFNCKVPCRFCCISTQSIATDNSSEEIRFIDWQNVYFSNFIYYWKHIVSFNAKIKGSCLQIYSTPLPVELKHPWTHTSSYIVRVRKKLVGICMFICTNS